MRRSEWIAGAAGVGGLIAARQTDAALVGARRALVSSNRAAIYVANRGSSNVSAYSLTGIKLFSYQVTGPNGVAVDAIGNVYVTSTLSSVEVLSPNGGGQIASFEASSPQQICTDSQSNIYYAGYGNNSLYKTTRTGSLLLTISGVSGANGVAIDASGNIYATAYSTQTVYKFPPSGGSASLSFSVGSSPAGLVVDVFNNIWVGVGNTVVKYSSSGSSLLTVSGFSTASGLSTDGFGNIYVASRGQNTVSAINQSGAILWTIPVGASPYAVAIAPPYIPY